MNIIIGGDSWSLGEWSEGSTHLLHGGLTQYLSDCGHNVINVGQSASSNRESLLRITNFLRTNLHLNSSYTRVIIFQTEWTRDFPYFLDEDCAYYDRPSELRDRLVSRFYYELSALADEFNILIDVIGGASDTIYIEDFEKIYPGVRIVCQSLVNLLINNNPLIENPVFSTWPKRTEKLLNNHKTHITDNIQLQQLITDLDRGAQRVADFSNNPNWFWPDGTHPNRVAHKELFNFLSEQKLYDT